jgi:hypothetical protein
MSAFAENIRDELTIVSCRSQTYASFRAWLSAILCASLRSRFGSAYTGVITKMHNQATLEKYSFSVIVGYFLLIVTGVIVGKIAGTGFGDPFLFLISLAFILPITILVILVGYPVFEWIVSLQLGIPFILKVFLAGFLSGILPLILFGVGYALLTDGFGSLKEFFSMLLVLVGMSIPFVLCSSIAYVFINKWL